MPASLVRCLLAVAVCLAVTSSVRSAEARPRARSLSHAKVSHPAKAKPQRDRKVKASATGKPAKRPLKPPSSDNVAPRNLTRV